MLVIAAVPSRLGVAAWGFGSVLTRVERALAGAVLDLSAASLILAPLLAVLTVCVPVVARRGRTPEWQRLGAAAWGLPGGFALWALTVAAQEVKSERGAFPTVFDLLSGANASFVRGALGFLGFPRVWAPALAGLVLLALAVRWGWRRRAGELSAWRPWALGVAAGLAVGAGASVGAASGLAALDNRFGTAALGDPLTGIVESTFDLLRREGPSTPRALVVTAELPKEALGAGAARLGWPPAHPGPHPHARPLDPGLEPTSGDPRGRELLAALREVSEALFDPLDPKVAVFQLSLEGLRADDLHALHPEAPRELAPFLNGLYQGGEGVLASPSMYQAGVRTAQGLGAMTCGLGTLPYNLSLIRDLQPVAVRCATDVLGAAGFTSSFFYGSDASFDSMDVFLRAHGVGAVVSQRELPATLPKGTWSGLTDLAVFDAAVRAVAEGVKAGPQFVLLMSLSNHSPFTAPEDLPDEVRDRVARSLAAATNRAGDDDRPRLLTYSYTDAAVERLFQQLDASGLAERSLVVLAADHSTGHAYVWGPEEIADDAAKAQVPFLVVIPKAFAARAKDPAALAAALARAQRLVASAPLSQNDVPAMLLALLSAHPSLRALPEEERWHTLGGQITSPYFDPGGATETSVLGINGVSELFALDRSGRRVGGYEDSVFLKTRADRYRVTPRLIPVTAVLQEVLQGN